jgi:carbamate kinase
MSGRTSTLSEAKSRSTTTARFAVVAFGGNAILRPGQRGTVDEQVDNLEEMARQLTAMIEAGWSVCVTHGNGPQVGNIALQQEAGSSQVPPMPLDVCGAMSQGEIGYLLEMALEREFARREISRPIVTVITRCVVDRDDPAFHNPTKPIGPFYDQQTAERLHVERGWVMVSDSGRGFRRVVPSPIPTRIVEREAIRTLMHSGTLVIASGGGGVPVLAETGGGYRGTEAVIDKDLAGCLLARELGAQALVLLTQVPQVLVDFGTPQQRGLNETTLVEIQTLAAEGQFPPGSMGPKVDAATTFLSAGGELVIITSPALLAESLQDRAGTRIRPSS